MKLTKKLDLSAPWFTYVKEIEALFGNDPDISMSFDEEHLDLYLYVHNHDKADALTKLLPSVKTFGNIAMKIAVFNTNDGEDDPVIFLKRLFQDNRAVVGFETTPKGTYVVFRKEVVQFYNDQLDDVHGNKSTLYQEIAKDIFGGVQGVYFCTE